MRSVFLAPALCLAMAAFCFSQDIKPEAGETGIHGNGGANPENHLSTLATAADQGPAVDPPPAADTPSEKSEKTSKFGGKARLPVPYVRPDADRRFKNYLEGTFGPFALTRYAATAGLLTLRNSPKEWGEKPDGFARRLLNVTSKNVIKATTTYALDEAMGLDSTFYLSRDRSVAARLRNCVFSAVTARNKRGHRVIGVPRFAGSFLSEVVSSTMWYPSRYDQDHGFKGGAIAIGVSAGMNLFREFVLKR